MIRFVQAGFIIGLLAATAGKGLAVCNVTATPVAFGVYDVFGTADTLSTGTVTVSCDIKATVTVSIGPSTVSGGFNPRRMKHATLADALDYNLSTRRNMSNIWGDGTAGTVTDQVVVPNNSVRTLTVYGSIPFGQDVTVGNYSDTVIVTIIW